MTQSSLYALANLCASAAKEAGSRGVTGQAAAWGTREEWTARELACRDAMRQLRNPAPDSPSLSAEMVAGEAIVDQLALARRDKTALSQQLDEVYAVCAALRARLSAAESRRDALQTAYDQLGAKYVDLQELASRLSDEKLAAHEQRAAAESRVRELTEGNHFLRTQLDLAEASLAASESRADEFERAWLVALRDKAASETRVRELTPSANAWDWLKHHLYYGGVEVELPETPGKRISVKPHQVQRLADEHFKAHPEQRPPLAATPPLVEGTETPDCGCVEHTNAGDCVASSGERLRDSERLDWLEQKRYDVLACIWSGYEAGDPRANHWFINDDDGEPVASGQHTLREAIDAAMRASRGDSQP